MQPWQMWMDWFPFLIFFALIGVFLRLMRPQRLANQQHMANQAAQLQRIADQLERVAVALERSNHS